ncbi:hypothetical protein HGM15179_020247 [Zosterops borbonicus]|uniref:WH1 domain-containing protein n=1 Tax=Zosterops borbonicus TaxID=364589 RepID=A0A8K1D7V7_9PASS|nr:hypothetical protein HGM15179_020247 [Zosterops borbonicus]
MGGGASRPDRRVRPPPPPEGPGPATAASMSERAIARARAAVLLYEEGQKLWVPAGGAPQSPSCVQLFHQPGTTAFRLVGRRLGPEQQVVLNCPLARGLRYSQATPQFHQWREGRRVWGLSFAAPPEAAQFAAAVLRALQALEQGTVLNWPELDGSGPEQPEQPDRAGEETLGKIQLHLAQELLEEVRRELHKMKEEIIEVFLTELRKRNRP